MKPTVQPNVLPRRLQLATLAAFAFLLLAAASWARADLAELIDLHLVGAAAGPVASITAAATPGPVLAAAASVEERDCPALLRHAFARLQGGEPQSLCQFKGKVLLVVNTASYCGYTGQYEALEALYRRYRDRGLVVVGFPSNDFSQEPGTNKEIAEFCRSTYGVQFPMFEKGTVTRLTDNAFYAELAAKGGEAPRWNFHKYVVDRSGTRVASFRSSVAPDSREVLGVIERLLAEKPAPAAG